MEAGLQDVFFGYDQWTLSDAGMDASIMTQPISTIIQRLC